MRYISLYRLYKSCGEYKEYVLPVRAHPRDAAVQDLVLTPTSPILATSPATKSWKSYNCCASSLYCTSITYYLFLSGKSFVRGDAAYNRSRHPEILQVLDQNCLPMGEQKKRGLILWTSKPR